MSADRRSFLKYTLAAYAALKAGAAAAQEEAPPPSSGTAGYKRIATEEAWAPPEMFERYRKILETNPSDEPGFQSMWGFILGRAESTPTVRRLQTLGEARIRDMDAAGIDKQILSLTAPGVQVFDADTAVGFAAETNDQLAAAIEAHPDRYAGLTAVAPQDPAAAAKEIERGMTKLGLNGVIISSHTKGEYLDEEKFWPIFEAAEAYEAPIYIHPRTPSPAMIRPYLERGLDMGIWGFGAEVGFHTLAIIEAGVFDRFPNLKIVIGHAGEGLPYWLYRMDYMHTRIQRPGARRAANPPSHYMKKNICITSSGIAWAPAITFAQDVLGVDRVLYAMDYPYQYDREEVLAMDALPITYENKKKFFQTNAERVFHL